MDAPLDLILELYRAAKETPVDEFQELALALIKAQTHFRTAVWGSGEISGNGLALHSVHLHNEPAEVLSELISCNRQISIVVEAALAQSGRALIHHAPTLYSAPDCDAMLDYAKRYGHLNNMTITTSSQRQTPGLWLSLYRPDPNDHFSQAEGHLLEQLVHHLVEALEINRLLGNVHIPAHANSGTAGTRAIARTDGTLYHCGKKFTDLLLGIWPEWQCGRLPAELMSSLHPGKESILSGHSIAVSTATIGNMLMLTIRKISPLHILSQRELEVARLYTQGNSYKEIGLLMNISPATVRNFLGRIYAKLGVNNKVGLVSLLSD